jgi:hypothetical protein
MTVLLNFEDDSTAWINSQLSSTTNGTEALQAAQSLLNQVQLTASQLTRDLQAVTDSTSQTLKTRLSVQEVKTKTSGLSRRIQGALAQLAPLNSSESPSKGVPAVSTAHQDEAFSNLITLDLVVGRMEKTRDALKEAENWNSLAMEMEAIFDSRNYEKAAARLEV